MPGPSVARLASSHKIILLVSQNHTFGGCAANPNMLYRSKSIMVYFALLKTGEKVLTPALPSSNHCCAESNNCCAVWERVFLAPR